MQAFSKKIRFRNAWELVLDKQNVTKGGKASCCGGRGTESERVASEERRGESAGVFRVTLALLPSASFREGASRLASPFMLAAVGADLCLPLKSVRKTLSQAKPLGACNEVGHKD
eukprot:5118710-Pleurochrysis_carterae.AAC.2